MAKGGSVEPAVGQYAEPSVCGSSDAAGASEAEQHNRAHRPDNQRHRVRLRVHHRHDDRRLISECYGSPMSVCAATGLGLGDDPNYFNYLG
jgi:hypothetical protein